MCQNMRSRLADFILENINLEFIIILEAGCGAGELTIPFAHKLSERLSNFKIIAYDLSLLKHLKNGLLTQNISKQIKSLFENMD